MTYLSGNVGAGTFLFAWKVPVNTRLLRCKRRGLFIHYCLGCLTIIWNILSVPLKKDTNSSFNLVKTVNGSARCF